MFCINCFHENTQVTNSRPSKRQPTIWRRRHCKQCGATFTTYERPSLAENKLIHNSKERFNLGVLTVSISKSFSHNPNGGNQNALLLAQTVEDILSQSKEPLTKKIIAQTTHMVLRRYDELAALQYGGQHRLISSVRRRGRPSFREREQRTDE